MGFSMLQRHKAEPESEVDAQVVAVEPATEPVPSAQRKQKVVKKEE